MSAPLDEKALDAALAAWFANTAQGWHAAMEAAIRAYLAASPSPSMEMEATIRRLRDYRPPSADPDFGREHHPICDEAADLLSQAQSALAAMRAHQQRCATGWAEALNEAEAAEAQVLRLTEENEALRKERTSLIETKREQIDRLTADRDHNAAEYEKVLNSYADENQCFSDKLEAAEARIKALEEALGNALAAGLPDVVAEAARRALSSTESQSK